LENYNTSNVQLREGFLSVSENYGNRWKVAKRICSTGYIADFVEDGEKELLCNIRIEAF
jgi:hypothetical protein